MSINKYNFILNYVREASLNGHSKIENFIKQDDASNLVKDKNLSFYSLNGNSGDIIFF